MLIRSGMGMQLSGSVGGVTASRNRYGAYLRNRTVPVNPNTSRQLAVRAAFAAATLAWAGLTDSQRQGWQDYATGTPVLNRLGETVTLSANCMFVRTNSFRLGIGSAVLLAAPPSPGLSSLGTGFTMDVDGSTDPSVGAFGTVGATAIGPGIVQYSPTLSAGVTSFQGPFSLYGPASIIATGAATVTQTGFRYGNFATGERRAVRIAGSDAAGRLSAPLTFLVEAI